MTNDPRPPPFLPIVDVRPRCEAAHPSRPGQCGKVLAETATRPWVVRCSRCGAENHSPPR